jgi:hypothetical protein
MSATLYHTVAELLRLFRDTWAECEAYRAMRALEASGQHADWEQCLKSAEADAEELFQGLLSAVEAGAPLGLLLQQTAQRLESARQTHAGVGAPS